VIGLGRRKAARGRVVPAPGSGRPPRRSLESAALSLSRTCAKAGDAGRLLGALPRVSARTLEAPYAELLEVESDRRGLLLRAAHGLHEDLVGTLREENRPFASLGGYAVAREGPVHAVEDLRKAPFEVPPVLEANGVRSALAAIISDAGEPRYVLTVLFEESRKFTKAELAYMNDLALHVGAAVRTARLAHEGGFSLAREAFAANFSAGLKVHHEPEGVLAAVVRLCTLPQAGMPGGSLADLCALDIVLDPVGPGVPEARRFEAVAGPGAPRPASRPPKLTPAAGPGAAIYSGRPELKDRVDEDYLRLLAADDDHLDELRGTGILSYLSVPLRLDQTVFGSLGLLSASPARVYDLSWVKLVELVADRASEVYGRKRLAAAQDRAPLRHPAPAAPRSADGVSSAASPGPPADHLEIYLPPSQCEVFNALARGLGSREIQDELHITASTFSTLIKRMGDRFGIKGIRDLRAYAQGRQPYPVVKRRRPAR